MTIMTRNRTTRCTAWLGLALLMACGLEARAGVWGNWPLNDGEGEVAVDLGPRSEDGDIGNFDFGGLGPDGNVWFDDADRGTVASFNGDGDSSWVSVGFMPDDLLTMDDDSDFTWAFWARQDEDQASPDNAIIMGNRSAFGGGDTSPREFVKFTPNRFEYHMDAGVASEDNPDGTSQFLDDLQYLDCEFCPERHIPSDPSEWIHHAVVKDGASLSYYRDGELWNTDEIETDQLSPDPLPIFFGGDDTGSGGENWRGFLSDVWLYDEARTAAQIKELVGGTLEGDFDGDGQLTIADIDDLTARSASLTHPIDYDLNSDSLVNEADVKVWVEDLFVSWIGDANLDGQFDSNDLVVMLAAGTYEIDTDSVWSSGDFNGNGRTNSSDLVAALSGGGYEVGPRPAVAAVPEPGSLLLALLGLLGVVWRRGRQSSP